MSDSDGAVPDSTHKRRRIVPGSVADEAFASSLARILAKAPPKRGQAPAPDADADAVTAATAVAHAPILARSGVEKRIAADRLEYRARRVLAAERTKDADKDRRYPGVGTMDYERRLKRIATRGAVQLFNAIRQEQATQGGGAADGLMDGPMGGGRQGTKKMQAAAKVSKSRFLDMLKDD